MRNKVTEYYSTSETAFKWHLMCKVLNVYEKVISEKPRVVFYSDKEGEFRDTLHLIGICKAGFARDLTHLKR